MNILPLVKVKKHSVGGSNSGNMIIHGDNVDVLPLLEKHYRGKIKCIYIDPPYNNGEIYAHYHDDEGHEKWLDEISKRLRLLKPLLTRDGSIWISIDDAEMPYLKVEADKVFGRKNFISTVIWQQRTTRENRSVFSNNHEYILIYAIDPKEFKKSRNLLPLKNEVLIRYKNPDGDPRGPWQSVSANVQAGHAVPSQFYEITSPSGIKHSPPNGRCWAYNSDRMKEEIKNKNIWFGNTGGGVPRIKKFLNGAAAGLTPETLWLGEDVGTNKSAKKHLLTLFSDETLFDTPKPEELIQRIFQIATNEGDLILDCYLGSGTTVATAHKMKRHYIGVEIGIHVVDYVVARMKKVIKGEQGGISKSIGWQGGGNFSFYTYKLPSQRPQVANTIH